MRTRRNIHESLFPTTMYYPQTRTPPIITSWFKVHLSDENYSHGTLKGVTRGVLPRHNGGLCPPNPPRLAAGSTPRCSLRSHTYGVGGGSYWKVVWGLVKGVTNGGARTRNKDVPKCVFYRNGSLFSTTYSFLFPRVPNHMATGVCCMVNAN